MYELVFHCEGNDQRKWNQQVLQFKPEQETKSKLEKKLMKQERKQENAQKRFEAVEKEVKKLQELCGLMKQEKQSDTTRAIENPVSEKKVIPMMAVRNKIQSLPSSIEKPGKMMQGPVEGKATMLDQGPRVIQSVLGKMPRNTEEAQEVKDDQIGSASGPNFEEWTVVEKNAESLHDEVSLPSSSGNDNFVEENAILHTGNRPC